MVTELLLTTFVYIYFVLLYYLCLCFKREVIAKRQIFSVCVRGTCTGFYPHLY